MKDIKNAMVLTLKLKHGKYPVSQGVALCACDLQVWHQKRARKTKGGAKWLLASDTVNCE